MLILINPTIYLGEKKHDSGLSEEIINTHKSKAFKYFLYIGAALLFIVLTTYICLNRAFDYADTAAKFHDKPDITNNPLPEMTSSIITADIPEEPYSAGIDDAEYHDSYILRLDYPEGAYKPEQVRIIYSDGTTAAAFWSYDGVETSGKECFLLRLGSITPPLPIGTKCEIPAGVHVVPDESIELEEVNGKKYIVFLRTEGKLRVYQ